MTSEIDQMKKFGGKQFLEDKTYRSSSSFDSQRELSPLQNHVKTDRFFIRHEKTKLSCRGEFQSWDPGGCSSPEKTTKGPKTPKILKTHQKSKNEGPGLLPRPSSR